MGEVVGGEGGCGEEWWMGSVGKVRYRGAVMWAGGVSGRVVSDREGRDGKIFSIIVFTRAFIHIHSLFQSSTIHLYTKHLMCGEW